MITQKEHPALWQIFKVGRAPDECCDCPFGTSSHLRLPELFQIPNPADPGEGHYDCLLLHSLAVWGENPKCAEHYWQAEARAELGRLGLTFAETTDAT